MTSTEKRVLLVVVSALLLGTGARVVRRAWLSRTAAAAPVLIAGEVEADAVLPDDRPAVGGLIDVNSAAAYELEALPGIGPVIAGRIVAYRDRHGPFTSLEQLQRVSGIGPKRLEAIGEYVTLGAAEK